MKASDMERRSEPEIMSQFDIGARVRFPKVPTGPETVSPIEDKGIDVRAGPTIIKNENINPDGLEPGNVYIINTLRFKDSSLAARHGSFEDVKRLISVLDKFHMHIECIHDANRNDIRSLMEKISKEDFNKLSCLMVIIMSHGYEGNMIAAKDGTYSLCQDILYPILQNKTLEDKLKMIVTQACKGTVNALNIPYDGQRPTAIPSDILQLFKSIEGYASYMADGYADNMITAKDGTYSLYQSILDTILHNKSLKEEFFKRIVEHACKTQMNALNIQIEGQKPKVIPSEILQVYSTVEGYVAYLNTETGSVFINTFCDLLEKHGFSEDILEIVHKVVANVKEKSFNTQIPTVNSNVTKKIVLGHYVPSSTAR